MFSLKGEGVLIQDALFHIYIPSIFLHLQKKKMQRKWIYGPLPPLQEWEALSKSLNLNFSLTGILWQRGIQNVEQARAFFRPSLQQLHDPFLMKNMEAAVTRLKKAIDAEEKILIYGDYDVDGTTSVALVYSYLKTFHAHCSFYVPDRYTEGYGVSFEGIKWAEQNGHTLIIALDVGIKSIDKVKFAAGRGIDFIICDHHLPDEEVPDAVAVLDPKQPDCHYPFKELSGCGLGFKLIQAFAKKYRKEEEAFHYLDLVAVSTCSDIVPLVEENRVLVHFGLQKLNQNPIPGLKALKAIADVQTEMDVSAVVFILGPRINAAGRIEHAKAAVELLLSTSYDEALTLAAILNDNNNTRRELDISTTEEAMAAVLENEEMKEARSAVLYNNSWSKGVLGIVASRCAEKLYRPTIVLTESNQKLTGSARSIPNFDLYKAICSCKELLENFGGHYFAAGLTMKPENLPAFRKQFEETVAASWQEELHSPMLEVNVQINFDQITPRFFSILKQMAPFGPFNHNPVFSASHVTAHDGLALYQDKHLAFVARQQGSYSVFKVFGFDMPEFYEPLRKGAQCSIAFSIEENIFNNTTTLQFRLKDIKLEQ